MALKVGHPFVGCPNIKPLGEYIMTDTCETVVIQTKNGPVEINKSDFNPKKHKIASKGK